MESFRAQVHGIFGVNVDGRRRRELVAQIGRDRRVVLAHDLAHPRDENAIAVLTLGGDPIGYFSAEDSVRVMECVRRGGLPVGEIARIDRSVEDGLPETVFVEVRFVESGQVGWKSFVGEWKQTLDLSHGSVLESKWYEADKSTIQPGHPTQPHPAVRPRPSIRCPFCGNAEGLYPRMRFTTGGLLVLLFGLFLVPCCLGLFMIPIAFGMRTPAYHCPNCRKVF